jgi:hypothetical protein
VLAMSTPISLLELARNVGLSNIITQRVRTVKVVIQLTDYTLTKLTLNAKNVQSDNFTLLKFKPVPRARMVFITVPRMENVWRVLNQPTTSKVRTLANIARMVVTSTQHLKNV